MTANQKWIRFFVTDRLPLPDSRVRLHLQSSVDEEDVRFIDVPEEDEGMSFVELEG